MVLSVRIVPNLFCCRRVVPTLEAIGNYSSANQHLGWATPERVRRLRLASGLVLFCFIGSHLLNRALGLYSLKAIDPIASRRRVWP